jgi:hypothetical protein
VSFIEDDEQAARNRMVPLVAEGRHQVPWDTGAPPAWVWVTSDPSAAMATVLRSIGPSDPRPAPLALLAVAADEAGASQLWELLTDPRHARGDAFPPRPSELPWLVVLRLPGLAAHPRDIEWLDDFARCWSWAWLSTLPDQP